MALKVVCYDPVRHEPDFVVSEFAISCEAMPTAIVRIYTSEGVVIGADGWDGGLNCAQKIFPAGNSPDRSIGCGLSDMAEAMFTTDHSETYLNFVAEGIKAAEQINARQSPDFGDYVRSFSRLFKDLLWQQIRQAEKEGNLLREDVVEFTRQPNCKTRLHFAGYFAGEPFFATTSVSFRAEEESPQLIEPSYKLTDERTPFKVFGSTRVMDKLNVEDPAFLKYKTPAYIRTEQKAGSLLDAVEAATKYIEACSSQEAKALDCICNSIGGRIRNRHYYTCERLSVGNPSRNVSPSRGLSAFLYPLAA